MHAFMAWCFSISYFIEICSKWIQIYVGLGAFLKSLQFFFHVIYIYSLLLKYFSCSHIFNRKSFISFAFGCSFLLYTFSIAFQVEFPFCYFFRSCSAFIVYYFFNLPSFANIFGLFLPVVLLIFFAGIFFLSFHPLVSFCILTDFFCLFSQILYPSSLTFQPAFAFYLESYNQLSFTVS